MDPDFLSSECALMCSKAYGNLKTLPDDYTGPRHVVTVRQRPPGSSGEDWFDWEKRPGPGPASTATGPDDGLLA
jgi:hypothetical protein